MIKRLLKQILSWNVILPFKKGRRFIFIYHDVSDPQAPQHSKHYSTTPGIFARQLDFFKKHFELVSLDEIVSPGLDARKHYASVVFDDGFTSVKEVAAPLLKERNIPFALFANKTAITQNRLWLSDLELGEAQLARMARETLGLSVERDELVDSLKASHTFNNDIPRWMPPEPYTKSGVYLDEAGIKALHRDGVVIGSHTVNHPVLSACDDSVQKQEIEENKQYLDRLLGQDTVHFAFPFGKKEHFNDQTVQILKQAGHRYFYTSNPAAYTAGDIASGLVPRIGLLNDNEQQLMFYINRQFLRRMDL